MRLSFPPLTSMAAFTAALLLPTLVAAQTPALVPPLYQLAAYAGAAANAPAGGYAPASCPAGSACPASMSGNNGGVAEDAQGNLYLPYTAGNEVLQWNPSTGNVVVYATGLSAPVGTAVDGAGNLYIADGNGVHVVAPGAAPLAAGGAVSGASGAAVAVGVAPGGTPFALVGGALYSLSGESAAAVTVSGASLSSPEAIGFDTQGNLYLANTGGNDVLKLTLTGTNTYTASALASTGVSFTAPSGIAVGGAGNVYVLATVGSNVVVVEINPVGVATAIAGMGSWPNVSSNSLPLPAPASEIALTGMAAGGMGLTLDSQGRLLLPTSSGLIYAMPAPGLGMAFPATAVGSSVTRYWYVQVTAIPSSLAKKATLESFVSDQGDYAVYSGSAILDKTEGASGSACTVGGSITDQSSAAPKNGYCELDVTFTPAAVGARTGTLTTATNTTPASLALPLTGTGLAPIAAGAVGQINAALTTGVAGAGYNGLAVNPWGALFGTDETNGVIEQLNGGVMQSLVPSVVRPTGIAFDPSGNLYYAETGGNTLREIPVVISSTGAWSYGTTSTPVLSGLKNPESIAADAYGDIYVADQGNGLIKEYIPGVTSLTSPVIVAGGGSGSLGGAATGIALVDPAGVAIDANGNLYISNQGNQSILRVSGGIITAIATNLPSTPWQLVLDPGGNLYAQTEVGTYLITAPASSSPVTTLIAGTGINAAAAGDGGPANAATFKRAVSLALASSVNANGVPQTTLYIGDYGTTSGVDEIRSISTANGAYATPAFASIPVNPAVPPTENVTLVNQGTASLTLATPNSSGPFYPSFLNTAWAATTAYTAGQQVLDGNGNIESVTTAGTSGATAPAWATAATNGATTDGTVTWSNQGLACTTSGVPAGASCQAIVSFNPSGVGSWSFTPPPPSEAMPFGFSYPTSTGTSTSSLNVYAAGAATAPLVTPAALSVTPASAIVTAGTLLSAIQATIDDQNGNPITSGTGSTDSLTIAITSGPGSLAAGTPTLTAAVGVASFNNLILDTAGSYVLTITDNTNTSVTPATVAVQVVVGAPASMTLVSGGAQSAFVNSAFTNPVVFAVTDAFGNPVAGAPVTVTAPTSGAAATFTAPATSDGNGLVTITGVTANATAGAYNLTAVSGAASGVAGLTNLAANVTTFPSEQVGTPSPAQAVAFAFSNATTVGSIRVVTGGATGLDFANTGAGTCAAGAQAAGSGCTVTVGFTPTAVGTRLGAVELYDANGNLLQTVYVSGLGQGALAAYAGAAVSTYTIPHSVALAFDAAGNIYYPEAITAGGGTLAELTAGTFAVQTPNPTVTFGQAGSGAAFDGAGNLYYSALGTAANSRVYRVPNVNGVLQYAQETVITSIVDPHEFAVDGAGNVFIVTYNDIGNLYELPAGSTSPQLLLSNLGNTQGLVFGTDGNLYFTANDTGDIYTVSGPESASPSVSVAAAVGGNPFGLGVDAAGDLYYGDNTTGNIYRVANVDGVLAFTSPTLVATVAAGPRAIVFDAAGSMYIADDSGTLTVIHQAAAPALPDFGSVTVGGTSAVESETVENIGNQPLQFNSFGFAAPFPNANGQSCIVGPSPTAPGASCIVAVQFAPTAVGNATGSVTVTDNAANESAPQAIGLSGTGAAIAQAISFTLATPVTYGAGAITLSATGGGSGSPVTFSITSGSQYATLSGTNNATLTITGAGTVIVAANQAGNSTYAAATQVTQTLVINPAADTLTIASIPTQTYPVASPLSAVATGSSNGAITYSVTGPATISAAGQLTITGAGTVVVMANQAANGNYLAGTATETITVGKAVDNLAITPSGTFTYPVAAPVSVATTGSSTGAITFSVTGPATINATTGLLTITGAGSVVVTADQAADANYLAGTATETITVNQAADTLSIAAIPTQTYPVASPLSAVATGSSNGAITYSVTGPATISAAGQLTITGAGTVVVTANQAATSNYLAGTATETITVNQAADTLSIAAIPTQTYPVASPLSAVATGSSNGAITYSVTGPATISAAGLLTITGAGTVVVTANQAATSNYLAGTATETITVNQAADNLAITPSGTFTYPVAAPVSVATTGSSTGAITFSVTGPATINATSGLLTITGAGTVVVTANQAANGNYLAGTATESITVNQAADTLSIATIPTQTYPVSSPLSAVATGSSAGAITYSVTGPATISAAGQLTITGAGTVIVTADQAANGNYLAGTATETITVNQAADTLSIATIGTQTYPVSSPLSAVATGSSAGAITYSVTGPATIDPNTGLLTITGAGTVVVAANQAANGNYLAGSTTETITVNQAADTLTIASIPTQTYPVSSPLSAVATGSSAGAITYSVTGPATISATGQLTITGAGTVVVTADQAASGNYLAGTATETITVNQEADTLAIASIGTQTYPVSSPLSAVATSPSAGAITYSVTGPAMISATGQLTITGAGTVVVTADQAAIGNYLAGTATETITVNQEADTLTIATIGTQTYPVSSPLSAVATGSSNGAITYSVTGPATISATGQLTITGPGTVVITANQAANGNYLAGTATESITVNQGTQTVTLQPLSLPAGGASIGATITLLGSSSVAGLPITYTVTGPATVSGNMLTVTGNGAITVTANQAGNTDYASASSLPQSFTSAPSSQTITFPAPASASYGSTLALGATASSGLPVSYQLVSGPATVSSSGTITITGVGTVTVEATQAGNASFNPATPATVRFAATPAVLTVTATSISEPYGSVDPDSCGSVNRHLTYTVTGYVNGNTSSILRGSPTESTTAQSNSGVGNYTITITQGQMSLNSSDYTLVFVNGTLTVTPAVLTVTGSNASMVYGTAVPALGATISGFVNNDRSSVVHGAATASTTATSTSDPGAYPVTPNLSGLSAANYTFTAVNGTLTITQASQSISFASIGQQNAPGTLTLAATASSGLPISYTVSGPATLSGSILTLTAAGTVTVTASQPGNLDYTAAQPVTQSFRVIGAKQSQTITVNAGAPPAGGYTYGGAVALNASASSGLSVSYAVTGPATVSSNGVVTFTGAGTVTVTITQAGNSTYNAATAVTKTFTVSAAVLTVTATSQSVVYGAVDPDHCGNVGRHLTYTVSGFVNGDSSSILRGSPDETTTATPTSGVGTYPITITQGSLSAGSGYTFVFVNGTLTITPAVLTVTCNNASGYYGQVDPDNCGHAERHNQFGYTVTGYVNGDGGSVVGGQGAPTTTANQGSRPGSYPITLPQGCLHAANYTFNYVAGNFTVSNQGGNGGR